jgi:hypothetical protein
MRYTYLQDHLNSKQNSIEILILGSSQIKDAVNPEWLSRPAINLASTTQHHNSDFKIYQGLKDRLPNLKTVVLEVSYSHFELYQNSSEFWKNNIYLEYYDVNCFDRGSWFKDRLIFFSNPPFFSDALYDEYLGNEEQENFNAFGYDLNNNLGAFIELNFDESRISQLEFRINKKEKPSLFKANKDYFLEMIDTITKDGMQVIVVTTPLYKEYLRKRNSKILERRNGVLNSIAKDYAGVSILLLEDDTLNYTVKDYRNHSHLNPDGGRKFTSSLNHMIRD